MKVIATYQEISKVEAIIRDEVFKSILLMVDEEN